MFGACGGLCGPVLGLCGKGFGLRREGLGCSFGVEMWDRLGLWSGVVGFLRSEGCVRARGLCLGVWGGVWGLWGFVRAPGKQQGKCCR